MFFTLIVVTTSPAITLTTGLRTLIATVPFIGLTAVVTTEEAGATAGCFAGSGFFAWASAGAVARVRNAGTSSHTQSGARFMVTSRNTESAEGALRHHGSYSQTRSPSHPSHPLAPV